MYVLFYKKFNKEKLKHIIVTKAQKVASPTNIKNRSICMNTCTAINDTYLVSPRREKEKAPAMTHDYHDVWKQTCKNKK